jgi:hypothetical protein
LDFLNNDKKSHLRQVPKRLIHDSLFASVKAPELAGKEGGSNRPLIMSRKGGIESLVIDNERVTSL